MSEKSNKELVIAASVVGGVILWFTCSSIITGILPPLPLWESFMVHMAIVVQWSLGMLVWFRIFNQRVVVMDRDKVESDAD